MSFDIKQAGNALEILPDHVAALLGKFKFALTDETYVAIKPIVGESLLEAIVKYGGSNGFMLQLKGSLNKGKTLSDRQVRAAANFFITVLTDGEVRTSQTGGQNPQSTAPTPTTNLGGLGGTATATATPSRSAPHHILCAESHCKFATNDQALMAEHMVIQHANKCFTCGAGFPTWQDAMNHRARRTCQKPGTATTASVQAGINTLPPLPQTGYKVPVLTFQPKHNLDLNVVPDGRFALWEQGKTEPTFILVKTVKKTYYRRGRYIWGMTTSSVVRIEPGTREVRIQRGDTKQLVGQQPKGTSVYYGEHEDAIKQMMADPATAMKMYGILMKVCAYCGRSLTDEESRLRGIGPDCWVEKHVPRYGLQGVNP